MPFPPLNLFRLNEQVQQGIHAHIQRALPHVVQFPNTPTCQSCETLSFVCWCKAYSWVSAPREGIGPIIDYIWKGATPKKEV